MGMSADPEYRAALLALFQAEDPARLIKLGAPDNEYEPEVGSVVGWSSAATVDGVRNLMLHWFDDWGRMSDEDAGRLADGIVRLQRQYGVIDVAAGDGM